MSTCLVNFPFSVGVQLDLRQEYLHIALDIYKKNMENKSISTELEEEKNKA